MLNWFDEESSWLAASVASMAKLCDHVVAFDGAYGLFPSQEARSSPRQAETIIRTADGAGMGYTIHSPSERWLGGEVTKRARLIETAALLAEEGDWLLVLDADELLSDCWGGTRTMLAESPHDAAEVSRVVMPWGGLTPIRRLFRVLPGITVEQTHYTVTAQKDGEKVYLCGEPRVHQMVEALPLLDIKITDRGEERDPDRKAKKAAYLERGIPIEQAALAY